MKSWRALSETIHLTVLGIWLGVLLMTGVAAAVLFPTIKQLRPTLPDFASYTGEHWRIAAGQPAAKLFVICDATQFACAMIGAISLLVLVFVAKVKVRRPAMLIRIGAFLLAMGLLGAQFFFVAPSMHVNMLAFWQAAAAGDNTGAEVFRAAFDKDHPTASAILSSTAGCVFVSFMFAAWCSSTHERPEKTRGSVREESPASSAPPAAPRLETPLLARTRPR